MKHFPVTRGTACGRHIAPHLHGECCVGKWGSKDILLPFYCFVATLLLTNPLQRRGSLFHPITHMDTPHLPGQRNRPAAGTTTHNNHKRQTSMPPAGCELAILGSERPRGYALDRQATGIGCSFIHLFSSTEVRMHIIAYCTDWHLAIYSSHTGGGTLLTDPIRKSTQTFK